MDGPCMLMKSNIFETALQLHVTSSVRTHRLAQNCFSNSEVGMHLKLSICGPQIVFSDVNMLSTRLESTLPFLVAEKSK